MEFIKGVFHFILVVIMLATPTCGKAITCSAGDFAAGEVGFILSYFPDDIDSHYSVIVQDYPFSAPTDASDETGTASVGTLVRVVVAVIVAELVFVCIIFINATMFRLCHHRSPQRLLGMEFLEDETGTVVGAVVALTVVYAVGFICVVPMFRLHCQMSPERLLGMEFLEGTVVGAVVALTVVYAVGFISYIVALFCLHCQMSPERLLGMEFLEGEAGTVSVGTLVGEIVASLVNNAVDCIITVVTLFLPRRQRSPEKLSVNLGMEFLNGVSLSILVVIMFATRTCGKAITCTAGDFAAGEVGRILCYFPDDIDSHHSVFVQYYPFSAPTDASATGVLLCKTEDVKASTCNEQDGYTLKGHTRNTILVEVVNITEKAAGRYNCQFLPPDHSPREMCNLTVRAKTAGETPAGEGDRDSDVRDKGNDSPTTTVHPDKTGTVSVGTLVGVIVAVIVVATIIIIVVIVFHLRRQRSPERSPDPVISPIQYKNSMYPGKEALDAPLMNTHSNGNKAPASGAMSAML